jgi:hypothetical protein
MPHIGIKKRLTCYVLNAVYLHTQSRPTEFASKYLSKCPMNHGGHSILARGMYAIQLIPWLQAYPAHQIKVCIYTIQQLRLVTSFENSLLLSAYKQ